MFAPNVQEPLQEVGMHKDILIQSTTDCPILASNTNPEKRQMRQKTSLALVLLLRLSPNLTNLNTYIKKMQMNLLLNLFTMVVRR